MSLFLKWLGGSLLSILPFFIVIDVASPVETSMTEYALPLSRIEERAGEFARATRRLFTANVSPNVIGSSFRASDPEHLHARNAFLEARFERREDHHRFRAKTPDGEVVYEIRGLKLQGPYLQNVEAAARAIGITHGLIYHYEAEGYRRVGGENGAFQWIPGTPPGLESLTLFQQGGVWHVETPGFPARR